MAANPAELAGFPEPAETGWDWSGGYSVAKFSALISIVTHLTITLLVTLISPASNKNIISAGWLVSKKLAFVPEAKLSKWFRFRLFIFPS